MRYLLLIYGEELSPEGAQASMADMAPWVDYTKWMLDQGLDRGSAPLAPTRSATTVRVRDGRRLVSDGPFAETKEVLGGFYLIECDDLDTALDAAARCPGALYGSVEVRPVRELPTEITAQVSATRSAG